MATTVTTQRFLMTYQNQVTNTYCGTESELGYTTGNNGQGNFGMHQGCSRATIAASGTIVINSYVLMSYILGTTGTTPANSTIFKNGTSLTPSNDQTGFYSAGSYPSANNARFLNIGARVFNGSQATDCFHSGDIAELIWYRTPLSTTERLGVESYLYSKWNIPVPTQALPFTHPFSSIRPFSRYFNPIDIPECLFWWDAADGSTITRSGTQVTSWRNKGSWDGSAVSRIGVVTSGTATFNGLNIVQFPVGTELGFTVAIPNQARAWFAVFRQTSQVTVAGPNNTQFFAIINQTQGSGQDSLFGPGLPTNIATSSYVMAEGPSGNPNGVQTGNTVPNGFNVMKQYAWINSAISTASNFQNVDGTSYVLTTNFIATAYRIDSVTYTINTNWYNNSCDLAEIIMYNSEISTSQRQQIEGYLAWKWGIQSSLISGHPYTRLPPSSALPFSPTNLLGCALWLDATDSSTITLSGVNMRQWNDKSGLANNMIPFSTFSNATVMSSYWNGLNVLNFSGAGVYQAPASSAVYPIDVYIIMALKDLTTHVDVFSLTPSAAVDNFNNLGFSEYITSRWYNGSSGFARTPNTQSATNETSTSFLLMNWSIANNNFVIRRNGTQLSQTASYTWTMTAGSIFQLGYRISPLIFSPATTAGPFRGYIGEIVAFNSQLSTSQRQLVEGYLASKWGLQNSLPSTHPYRNFQPAQTSFLIITPGTIATVTLSALSGSGGTITWTTSTNAVSYKWYVGTTFPTALVSGTVGNVLTTAVSYAFLASTNYFAWVIPVSSTGTDGATTQSAAASYTAGIPVLITTVGAGSVSLGAGSQIVIECWGAGGGSMGQDNSLGAGAGGAFAITTIAQTAAFTLFYSIGAGGIGSQGSGGVGGQTWARVGTNAVPTTSSEGARAAGGNGSGVGFPNNSTQAANSVGQTIFIGGAGGSGGAENGGGGAATPNGNGNNGLAGSGTAGGAAGTGGGGGGGGGGFSLSGGDGISNVLGGGGGGGSYNNAGGMGGLPGGAGGMGWSTGNSAPSGFVNTNPHGFGGDGGRGQIRYTRT
jgi:hypothetical protein